MTLPVVAVAGVSLRYGKKLALDGVTLDLPGGGISGLIGPDGAGKSSLLALIAGARRIQHGTVHVLGGDMASARHRREVCARIAYMPQGLGKNLYPTLSVEETSSSSVGCSATTRPRGAAASTPSPAARACPRS